MANTYCVYCHTNNTNGKKYIGITRLDPEKRWKKGEGYRECTAFYNAIKKYGWDAFTHSILERGLSFEDACARERSLIAELNTRVPEGYNLDSGGSACKEISDCTRKLLSSARKGRRQSAEHVAHRAESCRGRVSPMKGKTLSPAHRAKISEALRGVPHSEERRARESASQKGKRRGAANTNSLPVLQLTLEGEIVARFESASLAAEAVGGWPQNISSTCRGKHAYAYGYKWRYAERR